MTAPSVPPLTMIRRITLENYMSHARTVIEPADGLTVLVGPNNCGKSAVVSALQTVCGENAGDFMVRHGQKLCRVTVETDDGHTVAWQRRGATVWYTIDGRDVHRVGRGNLPDGLHALLRMPTIESVDEKRSFNVHFGCQKEPIFLVGRERDTAAFFSSSSDAERLLDMQRRHKLRAQAAKAEHRSAEADLRRLDGKLAALSPLEGLGPEIEAVEAAYRALSAHAEAVAGLERHIAAVAVAGRRVGQLSARAAALAELTPPPRLGEVVPVEQLVARIERCAGEAGRQRVRLSAVAKLEPPPGLHDIGALGFVCHRMEACGRQRWEEAARAAALGPLADPPTPIDTGPLRALGRKLKHAADAAAGVRTAADALGALADPPALADLGNLEASVARAERCTGRAERARAAVAAADDAVDDVERRIVRFVMDHPVCPTCGAVMDADHLMHGGPTHVGA